jgi:hypothetical protein
VPHADLRFYNSSVIGGAAGHKPDDVAPPSGLRRQYDRRSALHCPNSHKEEFETYTRNNARFIPNYGERGELGRVHFHRVCGIDYQPGGKQTNGEKAADALEQTRSSFVASGPHSRFQ